MRILFTVLLLVSVWSCTKSKSGQSKASQVVEATTVIKSKKSIVFFGNSLTAGYGLDISEAFPARIQQLIDSLGYEYEVINAGLSGETTASGNSRIDWVLKNKIDVFVLELGANDGLRGIPVAETKKNLQQIIDKVTSKYPEVRIVLAGMMVPPNMGVDYANDFNAIFPEIAEKNDLWLVPFLLQDVAGEVALNLDDGIHPSSHGHQIVAANVWNVLKHVL